MPEIQAKLRRMGAEESAEDEPYIVVGVSYLITITGTPVPVQSVQWTVLPWQAFPFSSFTPSVPASAFAPFNEPMTSNPLTISFLLPMAQAGFTVIGEFEDGEPFTLNFAYDIIAPSVSLSSASTGRVQIDSALGKLSCGLPQPGLAGAEFQVSVSNVTKFDGQVAYLQTILPRRWYVDEDSQEREYFAGNGTSLVDVAYEGPNPPWYAGDVYTLMSGAQAMYPFNDTPSVGITLDTMVSVGRNLCANGGDFAPEQYALYVMFQAETNVSSWVPLGVIEWEWSGTAARLSESDWGLTDDAVTPAANITLTTNVQFPSWVNMQGMVGFRPCGTDGPDRARPHRLMQSEVYKGAS